MPYTYCPLCGNYLESIEYENWWDCSTMIYNRWKTATKQHFMQLVLNKEVHTIKLWLSTEINVNIYYHLNQTDIYINKDPFIINTIVPILDNQVMIEKIKLWTLYS
jgi:hypothetical protein